MILLSSFLILLCAIHLDTTNIVNGATGNKVTLNVSENSINDITWSFGHNRIASSGPHKPINVTSTYRGKLASDPDGSLIIMNLHKEDEGTYSASIQLLNGEMRTAQYQLHVYNKLSVEDIKIEHNVSSYEPCHLILACTANAFDVTVFWTSNALNVTRNVINVRDPGAETYYTCTAQNPISHSSKSVTPREYCKKENSSWIASIVSVVVIGFIGAILALFYLWRKRQNEAGPPADGTLQHSL